MSFHIENRTRNLPDPIRSYNWELIIPDIGSVTDSVKDIEDLIVRCRVAAMPSRGIESIESYFMGMKQKFPGRPTFSNTLSVSFQDTENMIISKALYEWANRIFDIRGDSSTGGGARVDKKRDIAKTIYLKLYGYKADKVLDVGFKFVNAYIENQEEVSLDYNSNELITIPVTFSFDYWELTREIASV